MNKKDDFLTTIDHFRFKKEKKDINVSPRTSPIQCAIDILLPSFRYFVTF